MSPKTHILVAKQIATMNPSLPRTKHVALRDIHILDFGTAEDVAAFSRAERDDSFADTVPMPGFLEGHSHLFEGLVWLDPYAGFFDRNGPDKQVHPGLKDIGQVVARLQQAERARAIHRPLSQAHSY